MNTTPRSTNDRDDIAQTPLRLIASDTEDLAALSALVQDAVLSSDQIRWRPGERRFVLLLNRFRWENPTGHTERVQSVLTIEDVHKAQGIGIPQGEGAAVLSLLSLAWQPGPDGTGRLTLTFSGHATIALETECLEATLCDVSRPYDAPSGRRPRHRLEDD